MNSRLPRICLVSNSGLIGEALVDRLGAEGYDCDWFRTAEAARAALALERYGVVIRDIELPGADRAALSAAMRGAGPRLPPCILINADSGVARQAPPHTHSGVLEYLPRPLDIGVLLAKIRALCMSRAPDASPVPGSASASRYLAPPGCASSAELVSLNEHLRACERRYIEWALKSTSGRIGESAAVLGISRKSLWEKMRKLQMHERREHSFEERRCDLQSA